MSVVTTYPIRVAGDAAQISTKTIRRWMDTKIIALRSNDVPPGGSGVPCGMSRARIQQIAITGPLLRSGVSLSTAAKAAFEFSDCGNAGRGAGQLFPHGRTILTLGANGPAVG